MMVRSEPLFEDAEQLTMLQAIFCTAGMQHHFANMRRRAMIRVV